MKQSLIAGFSVCALVLGAHAKSLRDYVAAFNAADEELYTNAVPNAAAADFLERNVPAFECPDADVERTYAFRWWTYRKHLKQTAMFEIDESGGICLGKTLLTKLEQ